MKNHYKPKLANLCKLKKYLKKKPKNKTNEISARHITSRDSK
tara:strand:+ start:1292 stop:1417 length:126 start_codon:yes stop_codon:yes gene_type:complete